MVSVYPNENSVDRAWVVDNPLPTEHNCNWIVCSQMNRPLSRIQLRGHAPWGISMQVFQGLVLWHPTPDQKKEGKKSQVIVPFKTDILAPDQQAATLMLGREIPKMYLDNLDQVQVVTRPF